MSDLAPLLILLPPETSSQTTEHMPFSALLWGSKKNSTAQLGKWSQRRSVMSNSLWAHGLYSTWNSPGQNTGVGSLSLLQGVFPAQGSNPGFPHYRWIHYQLSHQGSPKILEWVAYPFSSGSFWPRNQTRESSIASGFFTNWAIREAQLVSTTKSEVFQVSINQQVFTAAAAVTSVVSDSVRPRRRQPTRLLCPWDSPGKNTGVGCHFLLRNIYWIPIKTLRVKEQRR